MSVGNAGERRFVLRGAPIIHDTIDNETIAINQLTGAYYSLEGAAAFVWQSLADPATAAEVTQRLATEHRISADELNGHVTDFLEQLVAEELVVATEDGVPAGPRPVADRRDTSPGGAAGLPTLRLQRYTDLEVMLLADPIHEVDETGWPMPLTDQRE